MQRPQGQTARPPIQLLHHQQFVLLVVYRLYRLLDELPSGIILLTGCGKTLRNCHSERSEESGPVYFQEDTQSEILRCALYRTVRGRAQDDNPGGFFRSL